MLSEKHQQLVQAM